MYFIGEVRARHRDAPGSVVSCLQLDTGAEVVTVEDVDTKVLYTGSIFDRDTAALLGDERKLEDAYGVYAYVRIDRRRDSVIVGTDRLSFSPLYYAEDGDRLLFASRLPILKQRLARVSPDLAAWEEMFNLGDILGDRTTIREVKRLRAGEKLVIGAQGHRIDRYWVPEPVEFADVEECIRRDNELLAEAMTKAAAGAGQIVVPLSGGDDSRRLAVTAVACGLKPLLATSEGYNSPGIDKDTRIAAEVAEELGAEWILEPLPSPEEAWRDELFRDELLGFETGQHEWMYALLRRLPRNSMLFDGLNNGSHNGHYFRQHPAAWRDPADVEALANDLVPRVAAFRLRPEHRSSTLLERVRAEVELIPPSVHRVNYFYLFNHQRRNVGLQHANFQAFGLRSCFPYLYEPVLRNSLRVPADYHLENRFQVSCTRALNPGAAAIRSTRENLPREYVRDVTAQEAARQRLALQHLRIRKDVPELFEGLGRHLALVTAAKALRSTTLARRVVWVSTALERMSRFLDWLEEPHDAGAGSPLAAREEHAV